MATLTPLRWGIFGAGKICEDFCIALSTLPNDQHVIEHVAARDAKRAEQFAVRNNVKKFAGDYKDVVKDPDVDVIYIGTISNTHKDLSLLALTNGKPVLCEKPVTMNSEELNEVLNCAQKNNLFFMEALWTRCCPLYKDLLSKLNDGYFGEPNVLFATFGLKGLFNIDRVWNPSLGGSVLMDIGIYTLTAADMFFNKYKLKEIKAVGHLDEKTRIDRSVGITLTFEGNKMVQLMANGDYPLSNDIKVWCDKGKVEIEAPFWCPEKYIEEKDNEIKERSFKLPMSTRKTNFPNSTGLSYEGDHVRTCLLNGLKESPIVSHATSKRIMGYLDEIRRQLGMKI